MPDYRHTVENLLIQNQCSRLEHLGAGIWKWYSPKTNIAFSVESYIPTQKIATEILKRAGIGSIVKPERD
jgi:hypothetical protein